MNLKTQKYSNDKTKLVIFDNAYPNPKNKLIGGHLIQVDLESGDILINRMTTSENTIKILYRKSFSNELWKLSVTLLGME